MSVGSGSLLLSCTAPNRKRPSGDNAVFETPFQPPTAASSTALPESHHRICASRVLAGAESVAGASSFATAVSPEKTTCKLRENVNRPASTSIAEVRLTPLSAVSGHGRAASAASGNRQRSTAPAPDLALTSRDASSSE